MELALPNVKRAGIFNSMTFSEVENAEQDDEGYVIMVAEGKTFRVSGAAGVFCTSTEYKLLQDYVIQFRPLLKPSTEQVFCRRSRERATVSETGEFLRGAWIDFGAVISKDVGDLTFTMIRKTLVSKSRKEGVSNDVKEQMARHMDHSVATADRYYDVSSGAKLTTAKFRHTFNKFHDPLDSGEDSSDGEGHTLSDEVIPSTKLYSSENVNSDQISMCIGSSESEATKSAKMLKTSNRSSSSCTFGKPDVFSLEDKLRLFRCCSTLIEKGKNKGHGKGVTKHEILAQVKSAGPNFADLFQTYTITQICNRVRCEIRKK